MSRPRILLADDHKLVLEGLKKLLESEFHVVGTAADGLELMEAAAKLRPDIIIADISMPNMNGLEAVRHIRKSGQKIKIVILTMHSDAAYAVSAFEAGAAGYVLKNAAPDELIEAIREVLQGRNYVTPLIAGELMHAYRQGKHRQAATAVELTSRQRDILQLLAEGYTIRNIAASLDISPKNVEYHKYRIMELLDIKSTAELIRFAVQQGLVSN